MNYLAHLFLAQNTVESRVGNLMGDFMRGVRLAELAPAVAAGVRNHRAVDRFTDTHPEVQALKKRISAKRRRFAGVIIDLAFDHYLINHWDRFSARPFNQDCQFYYTQLMQGRHLMPSAMDQTSQRIVAQDWFSSYRTLEGVGFALDRIAGRIRFKNEFHGAIAELEPLDEALNRSFLRFFPELVEEIRALAIETRH